LFENRGRIKALARLATCDSLIVSDMRELSLKIVLAVSAAVVLGCTDDGSVEYATDNPGGYLHQMSTDPADIFRNKVNLEADLEARGVEHPVGSANWRDYWKKLIAYWTQEGSVGTNKQVTTYIVQQRRARGLSPL